MRKENKVVTNGSIPQNRNFNTTSLKEEKVELLISGNYYIAFNEKQDIPIWNYLLSEDKTKIFIYDEDDNIIYDELVIDAPDNLFTYGEHFKKVSFQNLNLEENIVSRKNFHLFKKQFLNNKDKV